MFISDAQVSEALILIPIALPLVSGAVVAFLKFAESKMSPAQLERAKDIINHVVLAIEQTNDGVPGQNKKVQAEALASTLLGEAGVKISPAMIDTLMEAAVKSLTIPSGFAATKVLPVVK